MIKTVNEKEFVSLAKEAAKEDLPVISLYFNMSEQQNANKIKMQDLMKSVKSQFEEKYPQRDWRLYADQVQVIADQDLLDPRSHTGKGVGLIITQNDTHVYNLMLPIDDTAFIDNKPYLLPLMYNNGNLNEYHILLLSKNDIKLLTVLGDTVVDESKNGSWKFGDSETVDGSELNNDNFNDKSMGKGAGETYNGENKKEISDEADVKHYFQEADEYLTKNISNKDGLPVVLAGTPKGQGLYRKYSHNKLIMPKDFSIEASMESLLHEDDHKQKLNEEIAKLNTKFEELDVQNVQSQINDGLDAHKVVYSNDEIRDFLEQKRIAAFILSDSKITEIIAPNKEVVAQFDKIKKEYNDLAQAVLLQDGAFEVVAPEALPEGHDQLGIYR